MMARLVSRGMHYGRYNVETRSYAIVCDKDEPMVEFFDVARPDLVHAPMGQFVSRYYFSTLEESPSVVDKGLQLEGGQSSWDVSSEQMRFILEAMAGDVQRLRQEVGLGLKVRFLGTDAPPCEMAAFTVDHAAALVRMYIQAFELHPDQWCDAAVVDSTGAHYASVAFDGSVYRPGGERIMGAADVSSYPMVDSPAFLAADPVSAVRSTPRQIA